MLAIDYEKILFSSIELFLFMIMIAYFLKYTIYYYYYF
jgi:hypothetical protein